MVKLTRMIEVLGGATRSEVEPRYTLLRPRHAFTPHHACRRPDLGTSNSQEQICPPLISQSSAQSTNSY
jgi:hypothetical protein